MKISITPTFFALLALTLVSLASARLASPNPHLATLDGPMLYAGLTFLCLILSNLSPGKYKSIAIFLITTSLLGNLVYTFVQKSPQLPWDTASSIALKTIQSSTTAILGYGPNNFVEAFTALKPLSFNQSPLWHLRFNISRNQPLHILTTLGILGLLCYFALIITSFIPPHNPHPNSSRLILNTQYLILLVATAMQLLLPPSPITFSLFILLISLPRGEAIRGLNFPPLALTLILTPTLIVAIYWFDQVYLANRIFNESLAAIKNNQGTEAYNLQIKAIHKNRYHDGYRSGYATTNVALASAFSAKKDLSGGDREKIVTLIQQAIREARVATTLNPHKTSNWETLANVYRNLIGTVENAHTWAITSYQQAHTTDPTNPTHLLAIGSIHFGNQQYDQAISYYDQALLLKPDWANTHYHRALAFKAKGDTVAATAAMQTVLKYLPQTSPDYAKAQEELSHINEPFEATPSVDLQRPTPPPAAGPAGKITLPKDLTPTN